jgi:serine protease Do
MDTSTLASLSDQIASVVATVGASVVQVQGRRRPVSGVAYSRDIVITSARALGREDGVRVTTGDGKTGPAELVGWDPASGLAVLRVSDVELAPATVNNALARAGQIALPIARSWSNALTASAGIVAVVGGPLRTGRGQSLEQVLRITAPMHDGFAGGAVADASGQVVGIATNARIRGLAVVVPASIAWNTAAHVIEHGRPRVGFLGVSVHPVAVPEKHRTGTGQQHGLVVLAVTPGGPADASGVLVGDVLLSLDSRPLGSTDDLFSLLTGERVGRALALTVLRGGHVTDLTVTPGERPAS